METRRIAYETARLKLARYRMEGAHARQRAAAHVTQVSADALAIERVGVWLLQDRGRKLLCVSQFVRSTREQSAGQVLLAERYPSYFGAIAERRIIAAEDARTHQLTSELAESYLVPNGIASMLDAPIFREGRTIGVVCHEHIGAPRSFSQKDLEFASSVADMITLIFEQADRLELEAAMQEQAELRLESQKMEALGRMATAVAHDFNNLLATVALSVRALSDKAPPDLQDLGKEVDQMIEVGRRLTQQLMAFGKERAEAPAGPVDLAALVESMTPILRAALGRGVTLALAVTAHAPRVIGDASQLEQVVLNLALNARDAISGTGEIAITVREPTPDDDVAPDCVVLEVKDNGAGMDEATRARVFEPFFTTKASGHGLGLATVYGVVRRAGGVVRALSEPGAGTTMLVALPRTSTT